MKLYYDPEVDILIISFQPGVRHVESDEIGKEIVADFDENGDIVQLEVLFAKEKMASTSEWVIEEPPSLSDPTAIAELKKINEESLAEWNARQPPPE